MSRSIVLNVCGQIFRRDKLVANVGLKRALDGLLSTVKYTMPYQKEYERDTRHVALLLLNED